MILTGNVAKVGMGVIVGYRRGSNFQYTRQVLIKVVESSVKKTDNLIGSRVLVEDRHGNRYYGKIIRVHGSGKNNVVIATFSTNLPGQAIGTEAIIYNRRSTETLKS